MRGGLIGCMGRVSSLNDDERLTGKEEYVQWVLLKTFSMLVFVARTVHGQVRSSFAN